MSYFWDEFGRLHTKAVTEAKPLPTNNAYIYTSYFKTMYPAAYLWRQKYYPTYLPTTMPFNRHPNGDQLPGMSHDELYGVSILSRKKAKEIVSYLDNNHSQVCNLTGFKPTPFCRLNWFKVAAAFYRLSKEENTRTATTKYPDCWHLAYWQRPNHRWFYRRAAGLQPTLCERLWWTVTSTVSILGWKKDVPNLLLFFSLLHLSNNEKLGIEGKAALFLVARKIKKEYGTVREMLKYATRDLPTEHYNEHPFVTGENQ